MAGEKTEKATPKKRRDERKKGNIPKSQDIIVVVSLIGCFMALKLLAPFMQEAVSGFTVTIIDEIGTLDEFSNDIAAIVLIDLMEAAAKATLPLLFISISLSVIATGVQTKWLFSKENLTPKFNRLDPIKGIGKMFALRNLVELIKNILKISLLLYLIYNFVEDRMIEVSSLMNMDIGSSANYVIIEATQLVKLVCMWFVAIAGFDFLYQRWDYERQIKMSKQEIKEEYKQTEGDPQIKGRIKQMQQERARSRMMQAVPTADVVIKNPTHFAVALKYDPDVNNAPILVAKGQDELALRIIKVAEENDVYVREDKPLARYLYSTTNLNQEIPPDLYGTIAEILIYIYKLNHKEMNNQV